MNLNKIVHISVDTVIPAQAGIHVEPSNSSRWIPAYAGMTYRDVLNSRVHGGTGAMTTEPPTKC